jgi:hypothetical protein
MVGNFACGNQNARNMNKILNPWAAIGFAVLYVVCVFLSCFAGFIHPVCWAYFTVFTAILAVGPYYLLAARWQKFGVGTVLSALVVLFCLATGEASGFLSKAIILGFGILSDIVRLMIGNDKKKALYVAYPLLAVGNIGWVINLWLKPEWYLEGAAEEMGEAYSQGIAALQTPLHLVLVIILTAAAGVLGIWLCSKGMKKSAALLA